MDEEPNKGLAGITSEEIFEAIIKKIGKGQELTDEENRIIDRIRYRSFRQQVKQLFILLVILFVTGVVVFAVIKWAFQFVF